MSGIFKKKVSNIHRGDDRFFRVKISSLCFALGYSIEQIDCSRIVVRVHLDCKRDLERDVDNV